MASPPLDNIWEEEAYASPAASLTSIPSQSSSSGRRSRRTRGSSEDTSQNIIVRVQPFRVGGPHLTPLGSAFHTPPPTSTIKQEWDAYLSQGVREILQRFNISRDFLELVYYPQTDTNAPQHAYLTDLTALIIATAGETEQEWIPAAEEIQRYFIGVQRSEINVEILDNRAYEPTLPFPVASSDPAVSLWEIAKPEMISQLSGKNWVSLSLLRRGKRSGPKPLLAVLTVTQTSTDDWQGAREKLTQILDARGLSHVGVEIIRGDKVFSADGDRIILGNKDFEVKMAMGRSIGPRKTSKHPSTFGGFVRLQNRHNKWHRFGLTCFHCVAPADIKSPSLRNWQQKGIFVNDSTNDLEMDCPSLCDAEETERAWESRIKQMKNPQYNDIEKRLADPNEFVMPWEKTKFTTSKKALSGMEQTVQMSRDFFSQGKERLGKVFAASGIRFSNSSPSLAVDWALLNVDKSRIADNMLPQLDDLPADIRLSAYFPSEKTMQGLTTLQPDMDLFKLGRSTKFTVGKLNGVVTTTLHSWKQDAAGKYVEQLSDAYCVVPSSRFNATFDKGGDSGSFVLDESGNFVGLFLGGSKSGAGYFTKAEDLIEDIKRVTGAKDVSFAF